MSYGFQVSYCRPLLAGSNPAAVRFISEGRNLKVGTGGRIRCRVLAP
jgi:hypothetical protein